MIIKFLFIFALIFQFSLNFPTPQYKFGLNLSENKKFYTLDLMVGIEEFYRLKIETENNFMMLIDKNTCPNSYQPKCLNTSRMDFHFCKNCTSYQQQVKNIFFYL